VSDAVIQLDEATPLLEAVRSESQARGLALVGARAVAGLIRDHLYGLDGQRHRNGRHFYRQAGDSVHSDVAPQGARASITQLGFRQRLQGGTITARNVRNLTIPACPEAEGKRAGEFNDLEFGFALNPKTGALQPALVRRPQTTIRFRRHKSKDGEVTLRAHAVATLEPQPMFWLVHSVVQQPDPSVLPYPEQMSARAVTAIRTRYDRLVERVRAGIRPEGQN
jgi:hypothetical protein